MNANLLKCRCFLLLIFIFTIIAVRSQSPNQDGSIIGSWQSEEDSSIVYVFKNDNKCYTYYLHKPYSTFNYTISNTTPQCGITVPTDEYTSYLQLQDVQDTLCYIINGITDKYLSLSIVGRGGVMALIRQNSTAVVDCAGVSGGTAYSDNCGNCVNAETTYTSNIKYDNFTIHYNLYNVGCAKITYIKSVITEMKSNCYYNTLLSNLNDVTIYYSQFYWDKPTYYDAAKNTIHIKAEIDPITLVGKDIDAKALGSMLFQVYQQQNTGKSETIGNGAGFSNLEFEVRFFNLTKNILSGEDYSMYDMDGLSDWIIQLLAQNNNKLPASFNDAQKNTYFNFVQTFNTDFMGDAYETRPDPLLNEPTSAISLINKSPCPLLGVVCTVPRSSANGSSLRRS